MRSEFDFIHNIKTKYGLNAVGDDCAVLPKDAATDMVVTTDLLVEDIDFRLDWTSPQLLGAKVLGVSLSDVASMGATPTWAMLSIGMTEKLWSTDFLDRFYEGWFTVAKHHGVELIGGDISRTPDKIVFDSIVCGETPKGKAILRSGAEPGNSIFVSGPLGAAAGGLMMLESGFRYGSADTHRKNLIAKHLRPVPRIKVGQYLGEKKLASAMIDLSDGLSSDLAHICRASGVGARIHASEIPVCAQLRQVGAAADQSLALALNGGEDFELLFTSKEKNFSSPEFPEIRRIGEVTANIGIIELVGNGETQILQPQGYRHF